MNNLLDNLEWQGNSKKMYEAVIKSVPSFFAGNVKKSIASWIIKNNVKIITEDVVFKAVDEIAPAPLANNMIKPGLEKLRT